MLRTHVFAARAAAILALVAVAMPAASSLATAAEGDAVHTANIEHVATLGYPQRAYPLGPATEPGGTEFAYTASTRKQGGTDLETVTLLADHDGDQIPTPRDFVVAGTYRNGMQLVDVTDPEHPVIAQTYDCGIAQGDVQIFTRANGHTYVAYAQDDIASEALYTSTCFQEGLSLFGLNTPTNPKNADAINTAGGGLYGSFIIDITNPYTAAGPDRVRTVGWARWRHGSHNNTVSPDGRWLYISNQDLIPSSSSAGGKGLYQIEVFSLADVTNPVKVAEVPLNTGAGPHDITFSADMSRAYVAAVSHSLVLDTTNPGNPKVISVIEDPAITIHHQADPIDIGGRRYLVVSDELAGVIEGAAVCPGGGLHIYDVTGDLEKTPRKVGVFEIPQVAPPGQYHNRCTAHVFKAYPEQGIMTIAWYGAGVRVLDISDLVGPSVGVAPQLGSVGLGVHEIGSWFFSETDTQAGSQTWAAKIHRFETDGSAYIFANDLDRGLDVFRWDGTADLGDPGQFVSSTAASQPRVVPVGTATEPGVRALPYCVLLAQVG